MGKDQEKLIARAKKLIGNTNTFEVQPDKSDVLVFCKSCQSKFKIDSVHLNTQYQSHLRSTKHKESSEKKNIATIDIKCCG